MQGRVVGIESDAALGVTQGCDLVSLIASVFKENLFDTRKQRRQGPSGLEFASQQLGGGAVFRVLHREPEIELLSIACFGRGIYLSGKAHPDEKQHNRNFARVGH